MRGVLTMPVCYNRTGLVHKMITYYALRIHIDQDRFCDANHLCGHCWYRLYRACPCRGVAATWCAGHAEGYPDSFKQCFKAFYGYIATGDFAAPPPFPTFLDGHQEILLCEAILKSHLEQRWVTL
jgi:hypothetical protein